MRNRMKDPLDYTEDELRSLNKDELQALLKISKNKESLYNTRQLVEKTLINSLYGAMANKWFPLFNEQMAAAITGNGRYFIRKLGDYIEEKLQNLNPSNVPYLVYGDTDSVVGDTYIRTDEGDIKIEDLFNMLDGYIEERNENNFIKHVHQNSNTMKAASVNQQKQLQYNNINYVMKHKVKKRMFQVNCGGDSVTITEDHSMMVIRDNKLIETKPTELRPNDRLIKIKDI